MKRIIFLLLLFATCGTAFGQWTKPQLYTNINSNIRLKTYSPLRIAAVLDSIVDTMNTGSAGIGGSTGSVDNAILRANGTGGATLQTSVITVDDFGSLTIGNASTSGNKTITTINSTSDADLTIEPQDNLFLDPGAGAISIRTADNIVTINPNGFGLIGEKRTTSAVSYFLVKSAEGISGSTTGQDIRIAGGAGFNTGNTNGGNIYLYQGTKNASGRDGNIGFFTTSVSDWHDMERGIFEGNVLTVPVDVPTSGIFRYVGSEPEGSNMVILNPNGYVAKPILVARGTISGGATLRGIGSIPQTLIAAPGAGKYTNIISISVSYNYGTTVYDFGGTSIPTFKFSGGTVGYRIGTSVMNGGSDFNRTLQVAAVATDGGMDILANTAFVITTDDAGNASTGDGSLSYVIYFTIETTNN